MGDRDAESAIEHARRAGLLCQAGHFRESFPHFAAAEAALDALADAGGHLPPGFAELPQQLQDGWLQAIVRLAEQEPLDDATLRSGVTRAERVLTLTEPAEYGYAAEAREHAHYQRARFLTMLREHIRALPSALEVLRVLPRRAAGAASRNIEKQMRSTVASAYWDSGEHERAEEEFGALFRVALVDDDVAAVELVLDGLRLLHRRQPRELAAAIDRYPTAAAQARAAGAEARCRLARAAAWDETPGEPNEARALGIVDEYARAARAFAERGETSWQAKAVYAAAARLSALALVAPEHRPQAEEELVEAERLFREAGDWHGVGVAAFGLSALLHRRDEDWPVDDGRVVATLDRSIDALRRADRPQEEADALLLRAELAALPDDERFVEQCRDAFAAYERGRAARALPSEREFHDRSRDMTFMLLGPRIAAYLEKRPDDPRGGDLVWGLEQFVKARSTQDHLAARELWPRFLARDEQLRRLSGELEQARADLEAKQRAGKNLEADELHETIDRLERALRHRLADVAEDTELDLASTPVPSWPEVQDVLRPGELYIGLVFCRDDLFLRCRLTATSARFDAVRVPGLMAALLRHVAMQPLSRDELAWTRRLALLLVGPIDPDVDTQLVCPDRQLVAVAWHLLEPDRPRDYLGDRLAIAVVPAAGALVALRGAARSDSSNPGYLGVAHADVDLGTVDEEVENVRASYFPGTGRTLLTGSGHELVDATGHVGLLHVASHAYAAGLVFGSRTITPIALSGMALRADVLLLTGCYLGAFDRSDRNEFVGIVRQLLIATGAGAAVISMEPVPQRAGNVFSDLLVSALTGMAPGKPWAAPAAPLAVGPAVSWTRLRMREMRGARREPWWQPWFVVGDPATRLRAAP